MPAVWTLSVATNYQMVIVSLEGITTSFAVGGVLSLCIHIQYVGM